MSIKPYFERMAEYNRWMNDKVYRSAESMSDTELTADKGAYFESVIGTLNHILVADTIWLKRFAGHPREFVSLQSMHSVNVPTSLSRILHPTQSDLAIARREMDATIIRFCAEADDDDYDQLLHYTNTAGQSFANHFGSLMQHFFNHQTHHRGQLTTLFNQSGIDVGATDLVMMLREQAGH